MIDPATTNSEPPQQPKPFQFGLKHLFGLTLAVCIFLALVTQGGIGGAFVFVFPAVICIGIWRQSPAVYLGIPVVGFSFVSLMMCLIPMYLEPTMSGRAMPPGMKQLKQIALATHNYHDRYGTFPPAYITDGNGKPMHTWRVLLLPFLEQEALYKQYRFDEPWDGPNNRKLPGIIHQTFCLCRGIFAVGMTAARG